MTKTDAVPLAQRLRDVEAAFAFVKREVVDGHPDLMLLAALELQRVALELTREISDPLSVRMTRRRS